MFNRVYPRACGGTSPAVSNSCLPLGLSPRVRGNLPVAERGGRGRRSIPARAGEPLPLLDAESLHEVYPRACGGTMYQTMYPGVTVGLSPRVRGNLLHRTFTDSKGRSIPARAGEPNTHWPTLMIAWVYPRACGGTDPWVRVRVQLQGLSPRVRGNPTPCGHCLPPWGSIPARAGEPVPILVFFIQEGVYPRACGGTDHVRHLVKVMPGLSSRVRGNLRRRGLVSIPHRSIPARAGEPQKVAVSPLTLSVYPRACGGTP